MALSGVCTVKPRSRPYSINRTSRISELVWLQPKCDEDQRFARKKGLGSEECRQAGPSVSFILFTYKLAKTYCLREIECEGGDQDRTCAGLM
jgi:hypothetical protein